MPYPWIWTHCMRCSDCLLLLLLLPHTVPAANEAYQELYRSHDVPKELHRGAVPVCFHHGCESVSRVALSDEHWQAVARHLAVRAESAAAERQQIRRAIAEMERVIGRLAGTSGDRAGDIAGITTLQPQMDCVDESANTTAYLSLFEQAGLLHWHIVEPRERRGYLFFGGWPHLTAMIREKETGQRWAVDSWFRDNGELPDVMELGIWKDGWRPEGFVF